VRFLALPSATAWLLLAGTAALVLLLYLLKPSPRRLVIASSLIWQRVLKERKREPERLRWWLSLLLAAAIALALAAALTQPEIVAVGGAAEDHVVVIDNSASMAARTADGRTRLQLAIERGEEIVRKAGAGSRFLVADTMRQLPAAGLTSRADALARLRALTARAGRTPWFPAAAPAVAPLAAARDAVAPSELAAEPNPRRTWFITDGVAGVEIPPGTQVVSVFRSAPNVGITAFEARAVPADARRHEVYVEVANAAPGRTEVDLQLVGVGAAPVTRTLRIDGNAAVRVVLDVSAFGEGPLRAALRADADASDLDNAAYAYLPGKSRVRIALVTSGNAELIRLLRLLPRVDLQVLGPERLRELRRFDAVILDRVAPPQAPLVPALLIAPERAPWLTPAGQELTETHIANWDGAHPLLAGVSLRDVWVDRAALLQPRPGPGAPPLAAVARGPAEEALILATRDGRRLALLNFALDASNFPLQPGFPAFLANAVDWLTREAHAAAHPLGPVRLPLTDARVLDLDGREVPTRAAPDATLFDAEQPGVFTAVAGDQRMRVVVNLLDPRITAINSPRELPVSPAAVPDSSRAATVDPWLLLLLLAAALLAFEWWSYTRRLTV
jgi:hypothetical protein